MKKRLLSLVVIAAMCLSLLPVSALAAESVEKGQLYVQSVAYTGTSEAPCYLLTDENGNATTAGASESHYNIKWDGANLILKDAYVVGIDSDVTNDEITFDEDYLPALFDAIASDADVTLTLIGNNKLVGTFRYGAGLAVYDNAGLTIGGQGSLEIESAYNGIYAESAQMIINDGTLAISGETGIKCNDFIMNGGELSTSGKSQDGIYSKNFTMRDGTIHAVSEERYGIAVIETTEDVELTGGVVNAEAGYIGLLIKGDCNLIVGGDVDVNIQADEIGIELWYPEECANCNVFFNDGTLDISCIGENTFWLHGDIYASPTAGEQVVVMLGDSADSVQALSGSPFMTETAIGELVGQPNYIAMSTEQAAGLPYTDVQEDDWFYDAVAFASKSGLMTGTSATTFEPNTSFSRAMLVSVLHRLEGSPAAEGGTFTDVNEGDWYAEAVNWAAASGIVNGMDDGSFQPNAAITREQMAAILCNYAQYKGIPTASSGDLSGYSDADQVSEWAENAVAWAVDMGLIHGMSMNTLEPQGATTRAQAATVLMNAGTLLGGF